MFKADWEMKFAVVINDYLKAFAAPLVRIEQFELIGLTTLRNAALELSGSELLVVFPSVHDGLANHR